MQEDKLGRSGNMYNQQRFERGSGFMDPKMLDSASLWVVGIFQFGLMPG